jgi:hypothetical protein
MISVMFVVVSTVAMVINTLPALAGPPDEKGTRRLWPNQISQPNQIRAHHMKFAQTKTIESNLISPNLYQIHPNQANLLRQNFFNTKRSNYPAQTKPL